MPDTLPFGPTGIVIGGLVAAVTVLWAANNAKEKEKAALNDRLVTLGEKVAVGLANNTTMMERVLKYLEAR